MNAHTLRTRSPGRARVPAGARRQQGLATLLVVMLLFFVVSLLAAYTNRNLIFEQKTSGNQYRASQAFEAAEAGLNWTLSMLNGSRIDASCNQAASRSTNFQQRYLAIDNSGIIAPATRPGSNWPTCIFDPTAAPTTWLGNCACPEAGPVDPAPLATGLNQPAFRVWPAPGGPTANPPTADPGTYSQPSLLTVQSVGCTRMPSPPTGGCLDFRPIPSFGDGLARIQQMVALRTAVAVPPAAAIMVRGTVFPAPGIARLRVVNQSNVTAGLTVHSDDRPLNIGQMELESFPGTPGESSVSRDPLRANLAPAVASPSPAPLTAGERMFVSIFGMRRAVYQDQPGLRVCAAPCSVTTLANLVNQNPNRIIWVQGSLTINAQIGTPAEPAMLIIDGAQLTLQAGGSINGVVYITGNGDPTGTATIDLPDAATSINGALMAENDLATTYGSGSATAAGNQLTVRYDADIVNLVRWTYGSWVRTGGGWRDFSLIGPP